MAMKGVESLSATILLSELGDVRRFAHPCKLMGFLGLVPSELLLGHCAQRRNHQMRQSPRPVVDHGNGPALRQATQSKLRAEQTPAVCFPPH